MLNVVTDERERRRLAQRRAEHLPESRDIAAAGG